MDLPRPRGNATGGTPVARCASVMMAAAGRQRVARRPANVLQPRSGGPSKRVCLSLHAEVFPELPRTSVQIARPLPCSAHEGEIKIAPGPDV